MIIPPTKPYLEDLALMQLQMQGQTVLLLAKLVDALYGTPNGQHTATASGTVSAIEDYVQKATTPQP